MVSFLVFGVVHCVQSLHGLRLGFYCREEQEISNLAPSAFVSEGCNVGKWMLGLHVHHAFTETLGVACAILTGYQRPLMGTDGGQTVFNLIELDPQITVWVVWLESHLGDGEN